MDVKEFSQAIRAACYGCDDAFVGKAVAENWSIEQSAIEWQKQLVAERDQARDAADQPSPASRQRGAQPLTDDGTGGADTATDNHGFMQLVEECMKETGCTYRKACHAMAKKHPSCTASSLLGAPRMCRCATTPRQNIEPRPGAHSPATTAAGALMLGRAGRLFSLSPPWKDPRVRLSPRA